MAKKPVPAKGKPPAFGGKPNPFAKGKPKPGKKPMAGC